MAHVSYPTQFPSECAGDLYRIVMKDKSIKDEMPLLASCVWNVQGYAQYVLVGPAPSHQSFGCDKPDCDCTDEDCNNVIESLEKLRDEAQDQVQATNAGSPEAGQFGAASPDAALDPTILIVLIPQIIKLWQLLKELRNK